MLDENQVLHLKGLWAESRPLLIQATMPLACQQDANGQRHPKAFQSNSDSTGALWRPVKFQAAHEAYAQQLQDVQVWPFLPQTQWPTHSIFYHVPFCILKYGSILNTLKAFIY